MLEDMLKLVAHVLPGINAEKSSVWQGLRTYLPEGLPMISPSRAVRAPHYLFGLSSAGMNNAPAASRGLARAVTALGMNRGFFSSGRGGGPPACSAGCR